MGSSQHTQGMAYEAMVVMALLRRHGIRIHNDSIHLLNYRRQLIKSVPEERRKTLEERAERVAVTLPVLADQQGWIIDRYSYIEIVEDESGRSKVYDFLIHSHNTDRPLEVSVKTNDKVEDKSYRFNTRDYQFPTVSRLMMATLGTDPDGSWEVALGDAGYTVKDFLSTVTDYLVESVSYPYSEDHHILAVLTAERFLGDGGYIKTLADGGVRWYPEVPEGLPVIENVTRTGPQKFSYSARYPGRVPEEDTVIDLDFRVKFKDGKSKPARVADNGAPANLAATIRILSLGTTVPEVHPNSKR